MVGIRRDEHLFRHVVGPILLISLTCVLTYHTHRSVNRTAIMMWSGLHTTHFASLIGSIITDPMIMDQRSSLDIKEGPHINPLCSPASGLTVVSPVIASHFHFYPRLRSPLNCSGCSSPFSSSIPFLRWTSRRTTAVDLQSAKMGTLGKAIYTVGFWIRETGQAIDRLGSRLQGNYYFQEQCNLSVSLSLSNPRFSISNSNPFTSPSFGFTEKTRIFQ